MLHILRWPIATLEKKRITSRAIMMFIINGLIDIPVEPLIFTSNNLPTRSHQQKIYSCSYQQGSMHTSIPFFPNLELAASIIN